MKTDATPHRLPSTVRARGRRPYLRATKPEDEYDPGRVWNNELRLSAEEHASENPTFSVLARHGQGGSDDGGALRTVLWAEYLPGDRARGRGRQTTPGFPPKHPNILPVASKRLIGFVSQFLTRHSFCNQTRRSGFSSNHHVANLYQSLFKHGTQQRCSSRFVSWNRSWPTVVPREVPPAKVCHLHESSNSISCNLVALFDSYVYVAQCGSCKDFLIALVLRPGSLPDMVV
jgi:hypothetical protein